MTPDEKYPAAQPLFGEAAIIERLGSLSSGAIARIISAGQEIIDERFADGVFE